MSGYIKPLRHAAKKYTGPLYNLNAAGQIGESLSPDVNTPEIPAAPTIDDAAKQRDSIDRLRKRRGVLANIYGGGGSSTLGGG